VLFYRESGILFTIKHYKKMPLNTKNSLSLNDMPCKPYSMRLAGHQKSLGVKCTTFTPTNSG
jgi:hypothetical protein